MSSPNTPPSSAAAQKREKKRLENEQRIEQATASLNQVIASRALPKSQLKRAREAIDILTDRKVSAGVRAANVVSILEDLSRDPNVASFSRVSLWSAISTLESVREA